MKTKTLTLILIALLLNSCAIMPRKRFLIGAGLGGVTGSVSGAVLSPNSESRGLNALVFGLVGAIAGGVLGILLHDDAEIPDPKKTDVTNKKTTELSRDFKIDSTHAIDSGDALPAFVKERLKAVVVEELHEPDFVSEDGSLHEPHKIYRIKHQAELIAKPVKEDGTTK